MKSLRMLTIGAALLASSTVMAADLRVALQDDPDVLDPHLARTFVGRIVFTSLCDKLVDINDKLEVVPQIATEWTWNDDNTVLTMKLREGAVFHDGAVIDAEAVKANLDRARSNDESLRKSELASISDVKVVDANTLEITLKAADAGFLAQLTDRAGMLMSPASFDKNPGQNPVCSGPYKLVDRVQNDRIVLEKFADHWNADNYHFDKVTFTPIPDATVRLANLRSGDVDIIERVAPSDLPTVESDANIKLSSVTGLGYQAIEVNMANGAKADHPLGKDARLRQALNLSIDRDVINEVVGAGTYTPALQAFPPASFAFNEEFGNQKRDVEKAKALIKEAGFDRVPVEISYGNNTIMQQVFELVQAMGAEAGFDITLRPTEFAALQSALKAGDFYVGQSGWSGRVDPDGNIHQYVSCGGGLNDMKYCNEEVDRLLNAARTTSDTAERKKLYDEAQVILQQDMPVIYLFYLPWPFAHKASLEGFIPVPDGMIRLENVKLAQ
ncbi:ABC transporter substrate-binding protein [Nitratireductor aestuarii]|uniref:ABC transporter substrate-binding protein n=1 Tax=Nitratireductor aestuarii TaxID=1735103 RepID=A0A916RNL0_9HYPH|nr:ABC transporter substrate-binding protein [Nitratireductor aestuarii]GGA62905.1 ABC transporter substrate-binding protein [Nitratireductor aestuarii]